MQRFLRWLLHQYPSAWRARYEQEMQALLEVHQVTLRTATDLMLGAVDAHLHNGEFTEGVTRMVARMRSGVVMVFCAFMVFGVGWGMLQRLTDPLATFNPVSMSHPAFLVLFRIIQLVGWLAILAFLVGGLPVFFIAVKRAVSSREQRVIGPFWVAVRSLVLFLLATAALAVWHPQVHILVYLLGYLVLCAVLLVVGTVAVAQVIARTEFQVSELRRLAVLEAVILFGMAVSVVLAVVLLILITTHAPQLWRLQDVNNPMFVTGIVLMTVGGFTASLGLRRSVRAFAAVQQPAAPKMALAYAIAAVRQPVAPKVALAHAIAAVRQPVAPKVALAHVFAAVRQPVAPKMALAHAIAAVRQPGPSVRGQSESHSRGSGSKNVAGCLQTPCLLLSCESLPTDWRLHLA